LSIRPEQKKIFESIQQKTTELLRTLNVLFTDKRQVPTNILNFLFLSTGSEKSFCLQLFDVMDNEFVVNFTLQTFGDNHRIGQTLSVIFSERIFLSAIV
jgi:hypothetical protein